MTPFEVVATAFVVTSAVTLVGAALALPWVLASLPADWLVRDEAPAPLTARRAAAVVGRNLAGVALILAGLAMLVLPGQGILTVLAGLVLVDFPGKRRLLVRMLRVDAVGRGVTWVRARSNQPPLELPDEPEDAA